MKKFGYEYEREEYRMGMVLLPGKHLAKRLLYLCGLTQFSSHLEFG